MSALAEGLFIRTRVSSGRRVLAAGVVLVGALSGSGCALLGPRPDHPPWELGKEYPPADEPAAIARITELLQKILRESSAGKPMRRDAHAKAHGCVRAEVAIPNGLPPDLRVGLFERPAVYKAWIRFSNGNRIPQPDHVGDGRGMAIKLVGVPGEKLLLEEKNARTLDLLLINHPVMNLEGKMKR